MDKKHYPELNEDQIESLALALSVKIVAEYDRFLSGAEDDIFEMFKSSIAEEIKK